MVEPSQERPKLLYFYSPKSGPSRRVEAFLDQVLQQRGNHSTFARTSINVEQAPALVEQFEIRELPTILVVDGESVVVRLEGRSSVTEIQTALKRWLR